MSGYDDYPVSFSLFESVLHGSMQLGNITDRLKNTWKHSTRRIGGYWQATSNYAGNQLELDEMFVNGMLREIQVSAGLKRIWEGYIAGMTYTRNGITFERKLANTTNAIKTIYTRLGDNMLTNGSAESGPWTVYHSATVTQSTVWVSNGSKSCLIVDPDGNPSAPNGARISGAGYGLTIAAGVAYTVSVNLNAISGSWRISVNKSTDDTSIVFFSTGGKTGTQTVNLTIPATNTYAGTVDFRITSEAALHATGTIYGDGAIFTTVPISADSGWYTDMLSIAEWGRIETVLLRGSLNSDAAISEIKTLLNRSAWFRTTPTNIAANSTAVQPDRLTITVAGYVNTIANLIINVFGTDTASNQVTSIMASQSAFVSLEYAQSNAMNYTIENRGPINVWKILDGIGTAGDLSGNRWAIGVYNDRKLRYEQADEVARYSIRGDRVYYIDGGEADPRFVTPGMFRFDDMPIGPTAPNANVNNDPRYIFIDEVEFMASTSQLNLKPAAV